MEYVLFVVAVSIVTVVVRGFNNRSPLAGDSMSEAWQKDHLYRTGTLMGGDR